MCLGIVDNEVRTDVKYAYKVFREMKQGYYPLAYEGRFWMFLQFRSSKLYGYLYSTFARAYKIEKWYRASKRKIWSEESGTSYYSGFHCYTNERDAISVRHSLVKSLPVLKVAVEDIVASGIQDGRDVIVARRMKLIEEVD